MNNETKLQLISCMRSDINESFNVEELKTLCGDLGVDYENLGGEGKEARIRELISYFDRRGQLAELVKYCVSSRPQYPWLQGMVGFDVTPTPLVEQILAVVQRLEELCHNEPNNVKYRVELGMHLFLLGEPQSAREHFYTARKLKPEKRGLKRGWIIAASLAMGDVTTAKQTLDDVRTKVEFDYKDSDYYLAIYDSWGAALSGKVNPWESLISQCLSRRIPPSDIWSVPNVYFELAAGLAATNRPDQAWQAIKLGDIDRLGPLHMCGIACLPAFHKLQTDEKYGPKLESWFDARAEQFSLPSLRELQETLEQWRNTRKT